MIQAIVRMQALQGTRVETGCAMLQHLLAGCAHGTMA